MINRNIDETRTERRGAQPIHGRVVLLSWKKKARLNLCIHLVARSVSFKRMTRNTSLRHHHHRNRRLNNKGVPFRCRGRSGRSFSCVQKGEDLVNKHVHRVEKDETDNKPTKKSNGATMLQEREKTTTTWRLKKTSSKEQHSADKYCPLIGLS